MKNGINNKHYPLTAVWQDCEFCGKFTFAFRKKYYLSGK